MMKSISSLSFHSFFEILFYVRYRSVLEKYLRHNDKHHTDKQYLLFKRSDKYF